MGIEKIAKIAKELKESDERLAGCVRDICTILADHERRLQTLEEKLKVEP
ncbi:MAG: hypothetical protein QXL10_01620 [Candidatus Bathyarchaeia archaeon]